MKKEMKKLLEKQERLLNYCAWCTIITIANIVIAFATTMVAVVKHPEVLFTTASNFTPFEEAAPEAWVVITCLIGIGLVMSAMLGGMKLMVNKYHKQIIRLRKEIKGRR